MAKKDLTIENLIKEAERFCIQQSHIEHKELFGVTDGKAVGTLIEQKFQKHLTELYEVKIGSSAKGIDLPSENIQTDIKVTSIRQPQSSSPFTNVAQKIYGLGYNLLIFVYDKTDIEEIKAATLNFVSCLFVSKERTADYSTTFRLRQMVKDAANEEDIMSYLVDRNLQADEISLSKLAKRILETPPEQGYLTISNALQWRLQYQRVVTLVNQVSGITPIIRFTK